MSLAEVVVLGAIAFGIGFGCIQGGKWLVEILQNASPVEVTAPVEVAAPQTPVTPQ
tara:strand:- start:544 stop:711 length:168 start_codon:yes stop_codon:yes gene_type:complete